MACGHELFHGLRPHDRGSQVAHASLGRCLHDPGSWVAQ